MVVLEEYLKGHIVGIVLWGSGNLGYNKVNITEHYKNKTAKCYAQT